MNQIVIVRIVPIDILRAFEDIVNAHNCLLQLQLMRKEEAEAAVINELWKKLLIPKCIQLIRFCNISDMSGNTGVKSINHA
ncbi:MAG TPA: hypothetical protein VKA09_03240 [Nitrososphaeraceae archaeon]|nr:hypothetical protein [Nitrososphaeraceae archaeon]